MQIEISISHNEEDFEHFGYYDSINEAVNALMALKKEKILSKPPRCHKCVYEATCNNFDIDENCADYKRDPPDGGYYG